MSKCTNCGRVLYTRSIKNINEPTVRWNWFHAYNLIYQSLQKIKNEKSKKELLKKLRKHLISEYAFNLPEVKERQRELYDGYVENITEEFMDLMKYSIFNYVTSRYKSAIIICGAAAEYLLDDIICMTNLTKRQREKLQKNIRSQDIKLLLCKESGIIDEMEYIKLDEIRKFRNNYVHPKEKMIALTKEEAEKIRKENNEKSKEITNVCIKNLTQVGNKVYNNINQLK